MYDLRRACDDDPHGLCYAEFTDIERWLNATSTKRALGVAPGYNFQAVNSSIQMPFYYKGQAMLDSAALLAPLVDRGIRVLAYAGDVDGVCNYMVRLPSCCKYRCATADVCAALGNRAVDEPSRAQIPSRVRRCTVVAMEDVDRILRRPGALCGRQRCNICSHI